MTKDNAINTGKRKKKGVYGSVTASPYHHHRRHRPTLWPLSPLPLLVQVYAQTLRYAFLLRLKGWLLNLPQPIYWLWLKLKE